MVMWRSGERSIIIDIDILHGGSHDVKPMLKGLSRVSSGLLGLQSNIRFRMMAYML